MDKTHSLSEKEVSLILEIFEDETNIFRFVLEDVSVWQVLRFYVAGRVQKLKWQKSTVSRMELFLAVSRGFHFWKLISLRKKEYFVSSPYTGLRSKENDLYEDVWFDDLLQTVSGGAKLVRLNSPGYSSRLSHMKVPYNYDTTFIYYLAAFMAKFFPIKKKSEIYYEVSQLVVKHLGLRQISPRMVEKYFSKFLWLSRIYQVLLFWTQPKAVIVVDTGELALLHACKKSKISFIEMQHGVFSKEHPRSLRISELRYEKILLWPTSFAVYGDYWKQELAGTALIQKGLVSVVGNSMVDRYKRIRDQRVTEKNGKISIVVTTQAIEQIDLINFFKDFLRISSRDLNLTFKLHPSFDTSSGIYNELAETDARVKIISGLEEPNTFYLISQSDFHISVGSACHYDSLGVGTPTLVLKLEGYELMNKLISEGYAQLIESPTGLDDRMNEFANGNQSRSTKFEDICSHGFSDKMRALIYSK